MTYQAGSAAVSVTPDFRDFHSQVAEELTGLDEQFTAAGDKAGKSFSDSFTTQLKASLADLPDATVKASADTTELDARLDESAHERSATVKADADTTAATAKLEALTQKPWSVKVKVEADKVAGKTGTLADLFNLAGLGIAGGVALGPQALGLGAGLAGIGAGFGAAAADAGAFGAVAKGMFSDVTASQKALATAQEAYNKATTDKGRAAALAAEQKALSGLTPAERQLAAELTGLESAWKNLGKAEQPAVGQAIAPWLSAATSGMQLLRPLITGGANAIELLGNEAGSALQSPFWRTFASTFGQTGEEALQVFGESAGHVADGLAHIFTAFAPDIDNALPLVDKLAAGFDHWASSVSDQRLQDFLTRTFSPSNLATLKTDGQDLASLLENIAKSSQEMSPLAFDGVSNILDILGKLTPTEIEALTGLFLAIKTVGTISKGVSAVSGVIGTVKGLLGGGAQAAESEAEGTAAGTAAGTSAATAFTAAFQAGVTAGLAEAFTAIGAEGTTEAEAFGTAMGTAAAASFAASFAAESAPELTASLTGEDAAFTAEAAAAGTAMGSAMAAALTASFDTEGVAELGASLTAGAAGAAIAAGLAGAVVGAALGLGFTLALGLSGVGGAVGKIAGDVKGAASGAGTWLQPAGQQAAQGFISAWDAEHGAVTAAVGQLKGWTQAGGAGSNTWITPHGQQAGQGFASGFTSAHAAVNSAAAQIKGWVTAALPAPLSWLVNVGVSATQGFLNGLISGAGAVISYAQSLANSVVNTIRSALSIASPSKVTHELGMFTGQGFGLGLGSTQSFVEQQAGQLAAVSAGALAGMAGAQSLAALGVPPVGTAAALPGVGAPLSSGGLQMQVTYAGPSGDAIAAIVGGLQFHIQHTTGGDVQAALGQGQVRIT